jgi:YggT family protein
MPQFPKLPVPIFTWLVYYGIGAIILAMVIRGFASMFGIDERYAFIRFLARLTDPFIMPFRRFGYRVWLLDLSFLAAFFFLTTLQLLLLQALQPGW